MFYALAPWVMDLLCRRDEESERVSKKLLMNKPPRQVRNYGETLNRISVLTLQMPAYGM